MPSSATTTHGTLLARIADPSDTRAWGEFCRQYEEMIRAFARRQGVIGANADDIVQDVLLALTKAMPGFEYSPAKGKFRSYLKTVVVRAIVRRRERRAVAATLSELNDAKPADDEEALDSIWEEEWRQQHLRRAMRIIEAEFSATDLSCFRAYVVEGQDAAEVARQLGVSTGQMYTAKSRMLARLRSIIAKNVEDEG